MAHGERRELDAPGQKERVRGNEQRVGLLAHKCCEGCIDLPNGPGVIGLHLHRETARGRFQGAEHGRGNRVGGIGKHGEPNGCRDQLT
jgi:hypothetical protein